MSVIVVIAESSPFTGRLRRIATEEVVGLRPSFTEHVLKATLSNLSQVELVVISEEIDEDEVLDFADVVLDNAPDVPIVLIRDKADVVSAQAKEAGIWEVLDTSASDLDIERLLMRFHAVQGHALPASAEEAASSDVEVADESPVLEAPPLDPGDHRVIVVLSPKGGVGKTTTAINFAVALGQQAPLQTVVIDYDAQFGDVASMLNVSPKHTIEEAFTGDGVHPNLVVKGLMSTFDHKLLVMPGSESPAAMEKVSSAQAAQLVRQLSEEYSYVVVDTGSGLTDEALAALEVATDVVFVTTMDVSAVKALRRSVDLLDRLDLLPRRRYLLVNMADPGTGLTTEDIGAAMRMDVDATIPRSTDVVLSVNVGKPLAQTKSGSPFMAAIGLLIERVSGVEKRGRGGLFRRNG